MRTTVILPDTSVDFRNGMITEHPDTSVDLRHDMITEHHSL